MHMRVCVRDCECKCVLRMGMHVCVKAVNVAVHALVTCNRTRRWASLTRSRVVGGEQVRNWSAVLI